MFSYINHGLAVVEWKDAAQWERVQALDDCVPLKQITIGHLFERKEDGTLIIVYSVQEDGNNLDAVVIPKCWVEEVVPLTTRRRDKCRQKS